MRLAFRIISKLGFLLAAIGFFLPVACDQNAFQLLEYTDSQNDALIIGLFVLAIIGVIIGIILLIIKNKVPVVIDWLIEIASVVIGIVLLRNNELELQYGAYVIITGYGISVLFVLMASFIKGRGISVNYTGSNAEIKTPDN